MSLSFTAPINVSEKQAAKIRANWKRISRFGMAAFVLGAGTVLLLWMCLCFVGFTHFYGTQKILRDPFVIKSTLPCLAFLSYFCAVVYYLMVKLAVKRTQSVVAQSQRPA
jgi:hypothetical protein